MINIPEFANLKEKPDLENPFIPHYELDDGSDFYIEPIFYTQLLGFKERHEDKYQLIIDALLERVRKNKKVIFIGDFETNTFEKDGYIIFASNMIGQMGFIVLVSIRIMWLSMRQLRPIQ